MRANKVILYEAKGAQDMSNIYEKGIEAEEEEELAFTSLFSIPLFRLCVTDKSTNHHRTVSRCVSHNYKLAPICVPHNYKYHYTNYSSSSMQPLFSI